MNPAFSRVSVRYRDQSSADVPIVMSASILASRARFSASASDPLRTNDSRCVCVSTSPISPEKKRTITLAQVADQILRRKLLPGDPAHEFECGIATALRVDIFPQPREQPAKLSPREVIFDCGPHHLHARPKLRGDHVAQAV